MNPDQNQIRFEIRRTGSENWLKNRLNYSPVGISKINNAKIIMEWLKNKSLSTGIKTKAKIIKWSTKRSEVAAGCKYKRHNGFWDVYRQTITSLFIFSLISLKLVFHYATFFARSDIRLLKLSRFLISSSREVTGQKKKSLRAKKVA